jgi:hypothetical protein
MLKKKRKIYQEKKRRQEKGDMVVSIKLYRPKATIWLQKRSRVSGNIYHTKSGRHEKACCYIS